jgi:ubiquinone/menaquinone biosynthesis C-methylase UbiE
MRRVGNIQRDIKLHYDAWHQGITYSDEDDLRGPWVEMAKPYLLKHVRGASVLEIGCGRGAMASYLAALDPSELVAADFSTAALEAAAPKLSTYDYVSVVEADIQEMPFDSGRFDVAVSCETIEHVPSPQRAVCELTRVLKPGGKLILTTPNYLGPLGVFRAYKRLTGEPFTEVGQPINKFTTLPLTRYWIRSCGLQIDTWMSVGHYIPFPGRPPFRLKHLEGSWSKMFGLHSMVVATKPQLTVLAT